MGESGIFGRRFYLPFLVFLLFCIAHTGSGTITAVIAFGDSILDTGNNNNLIALSKSNFPPYGKNFPAGIATGRFSDGKVFSDLIAAGLGVKDTLTAYLDPQLKDSDLPTGVCFASGGSGLDPLTANIQGVLTIANQLNLFKQYISRLRGVVGEEKAKSIILNSLFLISAGNVDIAITYFTLHLRFQYCISSYTSLLVSWASALVEDLYEMGARRIGILSAVPVGCFPGPRTLFGGLQRRCGEKLNKAVKIFNSKLYSELNFLNTSLVNSSILYLDLYNPLLSLIQNPQESGFEVSSKSCCGTGLIEVSILCNTLNPFTCSDTSKYVFWDSAHPTETAYCIIVSQILRNYSNYFY